MQELSKEEIGAGVDSNYLIFAADSQGINSCVFREGDFVTEFISTYQVPWMNGPLKTDASLDNLKERVMETLKSYKTPMTWRVGPLSKNVDALYEILLSAGLTRASEPGMLLNLDDFKVSAPPADLTIELVSTSNQVDDFLVPFCDGFSVPEDVAVHFQIYAAERMPFSKVPQKWFIGYCKERPACCVTWVAACGINMIYNVCTVKEFRGRGFARRMVELAVESSLAEFQQPICLYASAMGLPLYKRMGFVEQFVRNDFVYTPEIVANY